MSYVPLFKNSAQVVNLVAEVSELVGQVGVVDDVDPNPTLRRENQIRAIHSSLLLDGNALSLGQATAVLEGQQVSLLAKDARELQNAYTAYEAAASWDPYSLDTLLKAYAMMMAGLVRYPGQLRSNGMNAHVQDVRNHPSSPASEVSQVMDELFSWLNTSQDHPLIKGAVFHYAFGFIHPFEGGNGRTCRLWHSLILREWRPIFAWVPVEVHIHRRQQAYYDALFGTGGDGDATMFVEFMLGAARDALVDVKSQQAAHVASDRRALDGGLTSEALSLVVEATREHTAIRAADVARLLGVGEERARAIIKDVVDDEILAKHGNGRFAYYTLV